MPHRMRGVQTRGPLLLMLRGLCVFHFVTTMSCTKTAEPIEVRRFNFLGVDSNSTGSKDPCIKGGRPDTPGERAIFFGGGDISGLIVNCKLIGNIISGVRQLFGRWQQRCGRSL